MTLVLTVGEATVLYAAIGAYVEELVAHRDRISNEQLRAFLADRGNTLIGINERVRGLL